MLKNFPVSYTMYHIETKTIEVNKWKVPYECYMAIYIKDRTHILHIFCEGKVEEYDLCEMKKRWCILMLLLFSYEVMSDSLQPQTVAHQASLTINFSRQEYGRGLP